MARPVSLAQAASGLVKPTIDLAGTYALAEPGPLHPCTTGTVPGGFDTVICLNVVEPLVDDLAPWFETMLSAVEDRACRVRVLGGSMFFLAREFPR